MVWKSYGFSHNEIDNRCHHTPQNPDSASSCSSSQDLVENPQIDILGYSFIRVSGLTIAHV